MHFSHFSKTILRPGKKKHTALLHLWNFYNITMKRVWVMSTFSKDVTTAGPLLQIIMELILWVVKFVRFSEHAPLL